MIWLVMIYLLIGLGVALWLPVQQARVRSRLHEISPAMLAAMTPTERKAAEFAISSVKVDLTTTKLVVAGLLWPTQLIGLVLGEIMRPGFRRARQNAHAFEHVPLAPCPSCKDDLAYKQGVDCIEASDGSDLVRFVCPCGVATEWNFTDPASPRLERTLPVVPFAQAKDTR